VVPGTAAQLLVDRLAAGVGSPDGGARTHAVETLGLLCAALGDAAVTATAVPILLHLHHTLGPAEAELDALVIDQLAEIALLGQAPAHETIVDFLFSLFRRSQAGQGTVPAAFLKLASRLSDSMLRTRFLNKILLLARGMLASAVRQG
jgi:hypothetical protein